jgi:hypothetical protein
MFSKHSENWELEVLSNLAKIVPIEDRADLEHSTQLVLKISKLEFSFLQKWWPKKCKTFAHFLVK